MDITVELHADDAWSAKYDRTSFLIVEVNRFESIIFVKTTNFLAHDENQY